MRWNRQGIQFALDEAPDEMLGKQGAGVEIVRGILRSMNEAKDGMETKEIKERGPAV